MEHVTITIATDGAAFDDAPASEVARILRNIARDLESGADTGSRILRDTNGNTIGAVRIEGE